jgi:hypothetical protein
MTNLDGEHMDCDETRAFFGGAKKPIDTSTLYRGMREGRFPRPINVGGARWLRSECEATVQALIAKRNAKFTKRQLEVA